MGTDSPVSAALTPFSVTEIAEVIVFSFTNRRAARAGSVP
jgi:hypothetical protein